MVPDLRALYHPISPGSRGGHLATARPCRAREEARGSVGQLLQDDLGDQPRDVGLRGAWIAQVEHRAVAVQGAGGEPIEHLG